MELAIQHFRQTIAKTRPWVLVAFVLAVALFLFFAAQGVRYRQASGNVSSAREEIGRLERATAPISEDQIVQEALLAAKRLRLENLHRLFDYPTTDTLMSIVSETAREAGLDLVSMTVERVKIEPRETLQYHVQPISVTIDGPAANVQMFLAALYDRVPVVVASAPTMVNLDADPSTKLQLRFYLSPEPIPEDDEETAG